MDVAVLADLVGVEGYRLASEWAHRTATREGADAWPDGAADPHELSGVVWDQWDGASLRERSTRLARAPSHGDAAGETGAANR